MASDEGGTFSDLSRRIRDVHDAATDAMEMIHNGDLEYALMNIKTATEHLDELRRMLEYRVSKGLLRDVDDPPD